MNKKTASLSQKKSKQDSGKSVSKLKAKKSVKSKNSARTSVKTQAKNCPTKNKKEKTTKVRKEQIIIDSPEEELNKFLDDPDYVEFKEDIIDQPKTKEIKAPEKTDVKKDYNIEDFDENDNADEISDKNGKTGGAGAAVDTNGFFYTNDKFINSFEDREMCAFIKERYPSFDLEQSDDQIIKKTITVMLNDQKFMCQFLEYYNINIFDFFKFLFRLEPSIFKSPFIKRIQKAMKYKKYATCIKKSKYGKRKRVRKIKGRR